ncbi:MAG: SufD family Fe-S cluster assembly protein [Pyrobaculum sp.]
MALASWIEAVRERAKAALGKPPKYGADIDLAAFGLGGGAVDEKAAEAIAFKAGVTPAAKAFYIQADNAYFRYLSRIPGVEVYRVEEFADYYKDLAKDYLWRLVPPDADKFTAVAALRGTGGYVIRVKAGVKVPEPVLACLSIVKGGVQAPHNVVIVEEGAEAVVYTGCIIAPEAVGLHVGISEFYVMKNAKLKFIMVHNWNKAVHVRPRTGVLVEDGGEYVEYYANLAAVNTLQAYPVIYLQDGAKTYASSVVLGLGEANIDIGTNAVLTGADSSAELVTRAIATSKSKVVMRALIQAKNRARGHVECSGVIMSRHANISTIPQLEAESQEAVLTHEASIGKLAEEEINYLMTKGFTYDEAVSLLIRGFITTDIHKYLPEAARRHVENIEKLIVEKAM